MPTLASSAAGQTPCWGAAGQPFTEFDHASALTDTAATASAGVHRVGWSLLQRCSTLPDSITFQPRFQWSLLPAAIIAQSNSAYPRSQQDGLRWAGRGLSSSMTAGAAARWGPITAALAPVLTYQQNEAFSTLAINTPGLSSVGDFHHRGVIDRPQRFGTTSYWSIHPGQSFIRADAYGATIGFSTENMTWGPARKNPILMSSAAPGFPHFFLGTSKPVNLRIVDAGVEAVWGRLAESDFFDDDVDNDKRLFAGLVATVSPRGSGLTIGVARAYVRTIPPGGLSLSDQIFGPYTGIRDNPTDSIEGDNQLLSAFFSLAVRSALLEVYGEYAREDHWEDARDLLMELDHSRGYTFGLEKLFRLPREGELVRVLGEVTNLGHATTFLSRTTGATFYTHSQVVQGYTHRGQLLGAPIGPGADAQHVAADYINPNWHAGLYYERARYENDVYYRLYSFTHSVRGHDTEWTIGTRGGASYRGWRVLGELAYSKRYNRGFVDLQTLGELTHENNLSLSLGVAWLPFADRSVP